MRISLLKKSLLAAALLALLPLPVQSQESSLPSPAVQAALWLHVTPTLSVPQLAPITLDPEQVDAIQVLLLNRVESDGWGCEDDVPPDDWLKELTYSKIALSPTVTTVFVQAGKTCGRTGQDGINAAMWIFSLRPGVAPVLLATPEDSFNGELYSIQPTLSSGFADLVVTWKLADKVDESTLTYFRFDGKTYQPIAAATLSTAGAPRITPIHIPQEP